MYLRMYCNIKNLYFCYFIFFQVAAEMRKIFVLEPHKYFRTFLASKKVFQKCTNTYKVNCVLVYTVILRKQKYSEI